jgi:hypothetical protein
LITCNLPDIIRRTILFAFLSVIANFTQFFKNMKSIKTTLFFLLVSAFLFIAVYSCSNTCTSQLTENRKVKLGFFQLKSGKIIDSTVTSITVYNTNDTFFYLNQKTKESGLELDQQHDTSTFYLKTDSSTSVKTDTLIFSYKREIQLISSECGYNTVYTDLNFIKYTTNIIDTVYTISETVSSDVLLNYKLVLKGRTISGRTK